jgi:arylsulfatase A-like enzyme
MRGQPEKKDTRWVVFEPNNAVTWTKARLQVEAYLTSKWRAGELVGATPAEAFHVRCGPETMTQHDLNDALDIAPTLVELGGGAPGPQVQGLSMVPLLKDGAARGRDAFLIEYYNESAWPWIVGMTYKAVRTEQSKLIHWVHKEGMDELYDLARDPYEITNVIGQPAYRETVAELRTKLRNLVAEAVGL